jgi:hypothetical protein
MTRSTWYKYGYIWVTLAFFLFSLIGHWVLAWFAFVADQSAHLGEIKISEYLIEVGRDTLENWQSEFLQLMWQVAGLALFLYVGSPQSKEGDERKEEKLDLILKAVSPKEAENEIKKLDEKYPKK